MARVLLALSLFMAVNSSAHAQPSGGANAQLSKHFAVAIERYRVPIWWASERTGIPADLLGAVIQTESGGNPAARSSAGAIGVMQLESATAAFVHCNPYAPGSNINGGARYLRWLLRHTAGGNLYTAVAEYGGGPANPQYGYAAVVWRRYRSPGAA